MDLDLSWFLSIHCGERLKRLIILEDLNTLNDLKIICQRYVSQPLGNHQKSHILKLHGCQIIRDLE